MPDLADLIGRILTNAVRINSLHDEVVRVRTLAKAKAIIVSATPSVEAIATAAREAADQLRTRRF